MNPRVSAATVLVTPQDSGLATNGTGFVVGQEQGQAVVMTCSHVIGHDVTAKVLVNGREPTKIEAAFDIGLDVALLWVPGLSAPALPIGTLSSTGEVFSYLGYTKLYVDDYMRTRVDVRLVRPLDLQHARARQSFLAYELSIASEGAVQPGHSGSPLFVNGKVAAIVSHRLGDGARGLAIVLAPALRQWPPTEMFVDAGPESESVRAEPDAQPPAFPRPPPRATSDPEDPNKDRFGGRSQRDGLRLTAKLKSSSVRAGFFVCDLIVEPVGDGRLDADAVRFFLHDTFEPDTYVVRRNKDANHIVLDDVTSYGVFAVGAQVRRPDGFTLLEYDLAKLPRLPKVFKSR
jgi:hypothetical protein